MGQLYYMVVSHLRKRMTDINEALHIYGEDGNRTNKYDGSHNKHSN